MMNRLLILLCIFFSTIVVAFSQIKTDVIIVGGGASGTLAAIQSSRLGVKSVVVEETTWLGGMLTSVGVSAIDGNHNMPSGYGVNFAVIYILIMVVLKK